MVAALKSPVLGDWKTMTSSRLGCYHSLWLGGGGR
jgi:hypothetical protein